MAKKPKTDDKEQSQRFVETARSIDVDESGKAFERAVKATIKKPTKRSITKK